MDYDGVRKRKLVSRGVPELAVLDEHDVMPSFNLGINNHNHSIMKIDPGVEDNPYDACSISEVPLPPQLLGVSEVDISKGAFTFLDLPLSPCTSPSKCSSFMEVIPSSPKPSQYIPSQYEKEVDNILDNLLDFGEPPSESDEEGVQLKGTSVTNARVFRKPSEKELLVLQEGKERKSRKSEEKARKTFDAWRLFNGHPVNISIEDMAEQADIRPLIAMLEEFMLSAIKQNGELYEPGTLASILRSLGRLIRAREEQRCLETSKRPEVPFNILSDVRFMKVRHAGDMAVQCSVNAGLGKDINRSDTLTFEEEVLMLASPAASMDTLAGLNKRFGYFAMRNFFVRGVNEVRALNEHQFMLVQDSYCREGLRYLLWESKNWHIDMLHCNPAHMRQPVTCYDSGVISTYKAIISRWPIWTSEDQKIRPRPHPMFLQAKYKIRSCDNVWFSKGPWGKTGISDICKDMAQFVPSLKNKKITNKSARSTGISRMEAALAPVDKGMLQTRHRDIKSYKGYSRESKDKEVKVLQDIICGKRSIYSNAMMKETLEISMLKDGDLTTAMDLKETKTCAPIPLAGVLCLQKEGKLNGDPGDGEVLSQSSKDMQRYMKLFGRLEAEKRFQNGGVGPQFSSLSNCYIQFSSGVEKENKIVGFPGECFEKK